MITRLRVAAGILLAGVSTPAAAETTTECLSGGVAASRAGDAERAVMLYREALSRPLCQTVDVEPLVRFSLARALLSRAETTPEANCEAAAELRRVVAESLDAELKAAAATTLETATGRCLTAGGPAPIAWADPAIATHAPPMAASPTGAADAAPTTHAEPPLAGSPSAATPVAGARDAAPPMAPSPSEATRPPLAPNAAPPMVASPADATGGAATTRAGPRSGAPSVTPPSGAPDHALRSAPSLDDRPTTPPESSVEGSGGMVHAATHPPPASPGSDQSMVGARFEVGMGTFLGIDGGSVEVSPGWGNRVGLVFEWSLGGRTSVRLEPGLAWQRVRYALDDGRTDGVWRWWLAELPVLARVDIAGGLDLCAGLGGSVVLAADERWEWTGAPLDGARSWSTEGLLGLGYHWTLGAMRLRGELRGGAGLVGVNAERDAADLRVFRVAIGVETLF